MTLLRFLLIAATLAIPPLRAESYRAIALRDLSFEADQAGLEASLERETPRRLHHFMSVRATPEAYLEVPSGEEWGLVPQSDLHVVFRSENDAMVSGFIDLHGGSPGQPVTGYAFSIAPDAAEACPRERFEAAKAAHFGRLSEHHLAGTAWFRHLAGSSNADAALGRRESSLESSFAVVSGGRAISENLALDRELIVAEGDPGEQVPLAEIEGITVDAIDWTDRLPAEAVAVDPLSMSLPIDQHALFAPSLPGLLKLMDRMETEAGPLVQAFTVRNPYRRLASRYRAQLGLDLPAVAARLLPVKSVALTGGDPFFATGTDVALLFETDRPELLFQALVNAIAARTGFEGSSGSEAESSDRRDFLTPDRRISSHVARFGEFVAVANSPAQIERLIEVRDRRVPALGSSDEFRFFRHRYPAGDDESAFIFLSDATIRRWAGPEIRIGASRRNRAAAALAELASRVIEGKTPGDDFAGLLGPVTVADHQVSSETYGSLSFLTPVSELAITAASGPEHAAYLQWKRGYESGWAQVFDPIALRLVLEDDAYDVDLTVLPLTVGSDYQELIDLAGNSQLGPMARLTPDESIFHLSFAMDYESEALSEFDRQLTGLIPGLKVNPLAWVGDSISVDLEGGFFWKAVEVVGLEMDLLNHLPISVRIASTSRLKLALFLTGLKGSIESSAPGMVTWETREHGEHSYVTITGDEEDIGTAMRLYYAPLATALLVSLDEEILKRAIDRETTALTEPQLAALPEGRHLFLESTPQFLTGISRVIDEESLEDTRMRESWKAVPVLNEWRRRLPEKDPTEAHRAAFGASIHCPGGKGYRWNPERLSMESVAYGHPAAPLRDGNDIPLLAKYETLSSSLGFEDGGLRSRFHAGPGRPADQDNPGPADGVKLAEAADLVPLTPGTTLSYGGRNRDGTHTFTTKVTAVEETENGIEIKSESTYTVEDEETHSTESSRLRGDLVTLHSRYDESRISYDKPWVELPAELIEGRTHRFVWNGTEISADNGQEIESPAFGENVMQIVGTETVETPAGTYPDCIRLETTAKSLYGDFFTSDRYVLWYHQDVGLVKYREIENDNLEMELIKIE